MNAHGPSKLNLFTVWAALMVLLFATWGVARLDLGQWNIVAAMAIAFSKALLVILIFMHVRHGTKSTWVFVAAGFFWLLLQVTLTMGDYLTRAN